MNEPEHTSPSDDRLDSAAVHHFRALLHPEMTIVEVNAGDGRWLRDASDVIARGVMYAIESDPARFPELQRNCRALQRVSDDNVSIYALPIATSDIDSGTAFTTSLNVTAAVSGEGRNAARGRTDVSIYTLDTLFAPIDPELVKINGPECDVLRTLNGARNLLKTGHAAFLVEFEDSPNPGRADSPTQIHSFMKSFGYLPRRIHTWTVFINRPKRSLHRLKRVARRWLRG
jgi:hypothetical protein